MIYRQISKHLLVLALILAVVTSAVAQSDDVRPDVPGENVVLQWNRVLGEALRIPGLHPAQTVFQFRSSAMMHAAMFDAMNSVDGTYTPYWTEVPGAARASKEAAGAKAARDVLVALYPSRQAIFDAELQASLTGISPARSAAGQRVGATVAARMIELRANDGWNVTPPPYVLSNAPGNWQPAPPQSLAAAFTHFPAVLPFALSSNSQFAVAAPPAMTSAEYTRDFNETKELGSVNSATRTADQKKAAELWASVGTPLNPLVVWNNVARTVAVSQRLSTMEMARLFALFNISVHDTMLTTFTSKYQHGLWRPVNAIRRADEDGNPATAPDPNWVALLVNPPYPAYAGNMAGIGASHATIFGLFFGRDDIPYEHTWEGTGSGMTRRYSGFWAMAQEAADSRIYGGIHFRFDSTAGQSAGRNVATYVYQNFMTERRCDVDRPGVRATAKR